ncbi:carboxymuconolactone decarboxylase family protein [Mucilaginibacter psychrotolerans]|uniref:Carboxymuconolactone decarboxylase family protein n=1 Tax=Mucilaginibacter psychrotolerans TaxID=1524096 RepID=A0A4Y8S8X6_9SPHI|nr:carboxymuconolactone decarboxylase family protein [Mucilaginibacter psychrotolerans]TFF35489.1 carboxymuconolactone decarboxylase family protein [Mucilaginibacter psychrotolerans]
MENIFNVPDRNEVSAANQTIFDTLKKSLGFVPNLYANFAYSDDALSAFLAAQGAKSSLTGKEKEIVNLVVSQVNTCVYCLSAHSKFAKMNGFSDEQIMEIRSGSASFDPKYDALAKLAKSIAENKGQAAPAIVENFLNQGYSKGSIIDVVMLAGLRIITNYVYALTSPPVDFPAVPAL